MNATVFGRIGQDAVLRKTSDGTSIAGFSVALRVYKKENPTWVKASLFGAQADSLAPYLTTGTTVALSGDLSLRKYEDNRDGGSGVSLDMNVNSVALLGGGQKEQSAATRPAPAPAPARRPAPPQPQTRPAQRPPLPPQRSVQAAPAQPPDDGNYDEEVGF